MLLDKDTATLRGLWEDTSLRLEEEQTNPACVQAERRWGLTPNSSPSWILKETSKVMRIVGLMCALTAALQLRPTAAPPPLARAL